MDSDSKEQSEFAEEFQKGWEKEQLLEHIREADTKELTERLSYCYPKMEEVSLKTKISVSELKHRDMVFEPEEEQTVRWFEEEVPLPYVPEFVKAREENQGAKRGTAVHRAMECIDFSRMEEQIQSAGVQTDRAGIAGIVKKRLSELLEEHKIDEQMYCLLYTSLRRLTEEYGDSMSVLGSNLKKMGYVSEIKSLISEFMQYQITPEDIEAWCEDEDNACLLYTSVKKTIFLHYITFLSERKGKCKTSLLKKRSTILQKNERKRVGHELLFCTDGRGYRICLPQCTSCHISGN